jgi:hypothetical protein
MEHTMSRTACDLCGRDPAAGFATVGDVRYCHDGPSPTCYERAPWPGTDGANTLTVISSLIEGTKSFADEMREKGIHVGMGAGPICVTCGEQWPCRGSQSTEYVHVET